MKTCTLSRFLVAALFLFAASTLVRAQDYVNFTGDWQRSTDGLVFQLQQSGDQIQGTADAQNYYHEIWGNVYGSQANLTIERINKYTNCTTYMQAYANFFNSENIQINITGTDGRCDLSPSYHESNYYYRIY